MRSTHPLPSPIVSTTLSRNVVLIACAASAGMHAGLVPSHLVENLWLGIAFAASVGLLLALIVALWRAGDPRRPAAAAAAVVLAALVVAYSLSRTVGLAPLAKDVEPVDAIGLLTQGVQVAGLVAALLLCHRMGAPARAARREPS
jgi:peptidoglycan/LPS O-acetylase OafA/YrhL